DQPGPERSLVHLYVNAGKRSVALHPDDAGGLAELLRWADVAITSEPRHRFEALRAIQPRLLQISITPHGLGGPLPHPPRCGLPACAAAGWAPINGPPDAPPLAGSLRQASYLAGLCGFVGAAAALRERALRSGDGQLIDVSELEALTATAGPVLLQSAYAGA